MARTSVKRSKADYNWFLQLAPIIPISLPMAIRTIAAHVPIKDSGLLLRLHVFVNSENWALPVRSEA